MYIKTSIKALWRTKGRTLLFFMIMGILTFILEIGIVVYSDVSEYLKECNDLYLSLGVVEYMGEKYPDEYVTDEFLRQYPIEELLEVMAQEDAVLNVYSADKYFANLTGYRRSDPGVQEADSVVATVFGAFPSAESKGYYQVNVGKTLYADKNLDGTIMYVHSEELELVKGKEYVVHGILRGGTLPRMEVLPFETADGEEMTGIEELQDENIPWEYKLAAETLQAEHDAVTILPVNDPESVMEFHEDVLYLEKGRPFSMEEQASGAKVCIINGIIADKMQLDIGDKIELSYLAETPYGFYDTYHAEYGFDKREEYEIVGITNKLNSAIEKIFVPSDSRFIPNKTRIGYEVCRLVLDNRQALECAAKIQDELPGSFRITLFDQGYRQAADSYLNILEIAWLIILCSISLTLAFLLFLGYMYVYRQKDSARTMYFLGTDQTDIMRYFIYGSMMFGSPAVVLATFFTRQFHDRILGMLSSLTEGGGQLDLRLSDFNKSMQFKKIDFIPDGNGVQLILTGVIIFVILQVTVLMFYMLAMKETVVSGRKDRNGKK